MALRFSVHAFFTHGATNRSTGCCHCWFRYHDDGWKTKLGQCALSEMEFFGRRILYWDKWTGNMHIEVPAKLIILAILIPGTVFRSGEIRNPIPWHTSWIMDSRFGRMTIIGWSCIQAEPGVTLRTKCHERFTRQRLLRIELTFNNVGVTRKIKYHFHWSENTSLQNLIIMQV